MLPHRRKAVLCITAFWPTRLPLWVIRVGSSLSAFGALRTCILEARSRWANAQKQSLPPLDGHACFKGTSIWQFTPCFTNARATLPAKRKSAGIMPDLMFFIILLNVLLGIRNSASSSFGAGFCAIAKDRAGVPCRLRLEPWSQAEFGSRAFRH